MRKLLRAIQLDLKNPNGYLIVSVLGVIGYAMMIAVKL